MDNKANDTFAFDLDNRLDAFFDGASPPPKDLPIPEKEPQASETDFFLEGLKSSVLAIDWEITDNVLDDFINHIDELSAQVKDDKINRTLLKLLRSLGTYIRAHKSRAHPDAIKQLLAVYSAFEESVSNKQLDQHDREKLLVQEVRHFKRLKAQITTPQKTGNTVAEKKPAQPEKVPGMKAFTKSIDNLKSFMASEFAAIRKELEQLQNK